MTKRVARLLGQDARGDEATLLSHGGEKPNLESGAGA
jgi:hypothetical protein